MMQMWMLKKRIEIKEAMKEVSSLMLFLLVLTSSILSSRAYAGLGTSLMQTAPVVGVGQFEVKAQVDTVINSGLNGGSGINISPHVETGIVQNFLDVDLYFGTGTTDFQIGGLLKYNLLPDLEDQVGLSFLGGASFLRDAGYNGFLATLGVLASKKFGVDFGEITPYAAFEFESFNSHFLSLIPLTGIIGAKWKVNQAKPWSFFSELSININDSLWGLDVGASYPF